MSVARSWAVLVCLISIPMTLTYALWVWDHCDAEEAPDDQL